jgi:hypothetical protein
MAKQIVADRCGRVTVLRFDGDDHVVIMQTGDSIIFNINTVPALISTLKNAYEERGRFVSPQKRKVPAKRK